MVPKQGNKNKKEKSGHGSSKNTSAKIPKNKHEPPAKRPKSKKSEITAKGTHHAISNLSIITYIIVGVLVAGGIYGAFAFHVFGLNASPAIVPTNPFPAQGSSIFTGVPYNYTAYVNPDQPVDTAELVIGNSTNSSLVTIASTPMTTFSNDIADNFSGDLTDTQISVDDVGYSGGQIVSATSGPFPNVLQVGGIGLTSGYFGSPTTVSPNDYLFLDIENMPNNNEVDCWISFNPVWGTAAVTTTPYFPWSVPTSTTYSETFSLGSAANLGFGTIPNPAAFSVTFPYMSSSATCTGGLTINANTYYDFAFIRTTSNGFVGGYTIYLNGIQVGFVNYQELGFESYLTASTTIGISQSTPSISPGGTMWIADLDTQVTPGFFHYRNAVDESTMGVYNTAESFENCQPFALPSDITASSANVYEVPFTNDTSPMTHHNILYLGASSTATYALPSALSTADAGTVEFWFESQDVTSTTTFSLTDSTGTFAGVTIASGKISGNPPLKSQQIAVSPDIWYNLQMIWSGTSFDVYLTGNGANNDHLASGGGSATVTPANLVFSSGSLPTYLDAIDNSAATGYFAGRSQYLFLNQTCTLSPVVGTAYSENYTYNWVLLDQGVSVYSTAPVSFSLIPTAATLDITSTSPVSGSSLLVNAPYTFTTNATALAGVNITNALMIIQSPSAVQTVIPASVTTTNGTYVFSASWFTPIAMGTYSYWFSDINRNYSTPATEISVDMATLPLISTSPINVALQSGNTYQFNSTAQFVSSVGFASALLCVQGQGSFNTYPASVSNSTITNTYYFNSTWLASGTAGGYAYYFEDISGLYKTQPTSFTVVTPYNPGSSTMNIITTSPSVGATVNPGQSCTFTTAATLIGSVVISTGILDVQGPNGNQIQFSASGTTSATQYTFTLTITIGSTTGLYAYRFQDQTGQYVVASWTPFTVSLPTVNIGGSNNATTANNATLLSTITTSPAGGSVLLAQSSSVFYASAAIVANLSISSANLAIMYPNGTIQLFKADVTTTGSVYEFSVNITLSNTTGTFAYQFEDGFDAYATAWTSFTVVNSPTPYISPVATSAEFSLTNIIIIVVIVVAAVALVVIWLLSRKKGGNAETDITPTVIPTKNLPPQPQPKPVASNLPR